MSKTEQVLPAAAIVVDFIPRRVFMDVTAEGIPTRHAFDIEYGGGLAHDDRITILLCEDASDLDLRNAHDLIEQARQGINLHVWEIDGEHFKVSALYTGEHVNNNHFTVMRPCLKEHCISGPHGWRNGAQDAPCHALRVQRCDDAGEYMVSVGLWPGADQWEVYADAPDIGENRAGLVLIDELRDAYAAALELAKRLNSKQQEVTT